MHGDRGGGEATAGPNRSRSKALASLVTSRLRTLRPASRLGVGLTIPGPYDAVRRSNGSPARAGSITQAALVCGAPLQIVKSAEHAALHAAMHAALHTAMHAALHTALNLSE